ncbi:dnaJ2 [Symbiodinium sp. CCMP2456]|nr:dnaJ2 [Symbiodinium sp. CCMP2456]
MHGLHGVQPLPEWRMPRRTQARDLKVYCVRPMTSMLELRASRSKASFWSLLRKRSRRRQSPREAPGRSAFPLVILRHVRIRTPLDFLDDAARLDPYQVLNIPFLSGRRSIRQAYARLCKQHHPDLNGGQESLDWMMIRRAYRILTDPEERIAYDSARITRNALSATEGVVAFSVAAAQQLGSVVSDVAQAAGSFTSKLMGLGVFLAQESQVWAERGSQGLETLKAFVDDGGGDSEEKSLKDFKQAWAEKRALATKSLEELRQARKDLEEALAKEREDSDSEN